MSSDDSEAVLLCLGLLGIELLAVGNLAFGEVFAAGHRCSLPHQPEEIVRVKGDAIGFLCSACLGHCRYDSVLPKSSLGRYVGLPLGELVRAGRVLLDGCPNGCPKSVE